MISVFMSNTINDKYTYQDLVGSYFFFRQTVNNGLAVKRRGIWMYFKTWLLYLLSCSDSTTISLLGWNCKIRSRITFGTVMVIWSMKYLRCLLYLVIVEVVHADLHNAWENHQDGGGDQEGVDVVKWLILLFFGSCQHLQEGMSWSDLVT